MEDPTEVRAVNPEEMPRTVMLHLMLPVHKAGLRWAGRDWNHPYLSARQRESVECGVFPHDPTRLWIFLPTGEEILVEHPVEEMTVEQRKEFLQERAKYAKEATSRYRRALKAGKDRWSPVSPESPRPRPTKVGVPPRRTPADIFRRQDALAWGFGDDA